MDNICQINKHKLTVVSRDSTKGWLRSKVCSASGSHFCLGKSPNFCQFPPLAAATTFHSMLSRRVPEPSEAALWSDCNGRTKTPCVSGILFAFLCIRYSHRVGKHSCVGEVNSSKLHTTVCKGACVLPHPQILPIAAGGF